MTPLYFVISMCLYAAVHSTVTAVSIGEFNVLVQNIAWKSLTEFAKVNEISFFDFNLNNAPVIFKLETLFPDDPDADVVTEQNFFERVWQFHLLLSAYYAIDLQPIVKITLGFWSFCQDPSNWVWKPFCLKSFADRFQQLYEEIKKMHASLLYFSDMIKSVTGANKTLTNSIHDTLSIFEEIRENHELKKDDVTGKLELACNKTKEFFSIHTCPSSVFIANSGTSVVMDFIKEATDSRKTIQEKSMTIEEKFSLSIFFLAQGNDSYGFQYDPYTFAASVSLPATHDLMSSFESLSISKDTSY